MQDRTADDVRELLRKVPFPGSSRDIVSLGFVTRIEVDAAAVAVRIAPNSTDVSKVAATEDAIRDVLYGAAFALVQIRTEAPFGDDAMVLGRGTMNPLQAELLEEGIEPQPDVLAADLAGDRGGSGSPLGDWRPPEPFEGPSAGPATEYRGDLPVFQWQVDPEDESAPSAESVVLEADWEFRVWWQALQAHHLVYASLQATRPDRAERDDGSRDHPVGRTDAVNLVFDETRGGVVAIYGTVRDFRPFIEAFRKAYRPADAAAAHAVAVARPVAAAAAGRG